MGSSASADKLEERLAQNGLPGRTDDERAPAALIDENQQLCRILNASVKTAKKK